MRVGVAYDPVFLEHDTGSHVENRQRLLQIWERLEGSGLLREVVRLAPRAAAPGELTLIHEPRLVASIQRLAEAGGGWLDPDTVVSPRSYEVACYAAGAVLQAVDACLQGTVEAAYALVRPPGHHATPTRAMGFCLFNNVALGARYALDRCHLERVLIVDTDVHHGNGTQDAFFLDPRVLYFSTHQYPYYPGTGHYTEVGEGPGRGYTVNVPLPAYCGDQEYGAVFEGVLVPLAQRFGPQLILVSAGYDTYWADPLAQMQVTLAGYIEMARGLRELARELCPGRLIFALEGGYHLEGLAAAVGATLQVLLERPAVSDPLGPPPRPVPAPSIQGLLATIRQLHGLS